MLSSLATPFLFISSLVSDPFQATSVLRGITSDIGTSCPDVFIANSGEDGTAIIRNALDILKIVNIDDYVSQTSQKHQKTYQELRRDAQHQDMLKRCPDSKIVVPLIITGSPGDHLYNHTNAQSLTNTKIDQRRILEIGIGGTENYAGETWERLCRFLDLGYSILERGRLRKFPGEALARDVVRKGTLGGRFGYGYIGIGSGVIA